MSKALVVFLYGVTLYITLSRWYAAGNSGLPEPQVVAPASWLFGILALTADFLEGIPVILALALTFILFTERPAAKVSGGSGANKSTGGNSMSIGKTPPVTTKSNVQTRGA